MEEGSLLKEALHSTENGLENCLIVDLFLLDTVESSSQSSLSSSADYSPAYFQQLAKLAVSVNAFVQSQDYPWMMGGDGPVFGVHLSSSSARDLESFVSPSVLPSNSISRCRSGRAIPHLRAQCRYGVSVADEWFLIGCLLRYTAMESNTTIMVAECWDVDDGQVVLIESAPDLPDWVDALGPDACRHRCWIQAGRVGLVNPSATDLFNQHCSPPPLSLAQALDVWQQHLQLVHKQQQQQTRIDDPSCPSSQSLSSSLISFPDAVQAAIEKRIGYRIDPSMSSTVSPNHHHNQSRSPSSLLYHRGAVVLPRCVARLFRKRPDLVSVVCQALAEWVTSHRMGPGNPRAAHSSDSRQKPNANRAKDPVVSTVAAAAAATPSTAADTWWDDDWVWTTHAFGRTQYAMLRNLESSQDLERAMIGSLLHLNHHRLTLKRLERQAARQGMPHLRYGVQVGRRLVIGLYHIVSQQQQQQPPPTSPTSSLSERRIQYWAALVARICAGRDHEEEEEDSARTSGDWLWDAWQAGPNHAAHSLDAMLQCPVLEPEGLLDARVLAGQLLTPLSHPEEAVATQIKRELLSAKRAQKKDGEHEEDLFTSLPGPDDVDSEEWMYLSDDDERLRRFANHVKLADETTVNGGDSSHRVHSRERNNQSDASIETEGIRRVEISSSGAMMNGSSFADEMLGGIHSFVKGTSSVEGVDHSNKTDIIDNTKTINTDSKIEINPTVFLNLLQMTLKAESVDSLTFPTISSAANDPFFSNEDYEMGETSEDDDNDEGDADDAEQDHEITELMNAMDQELQTSESISRQMDSAGLDAGVGDETNNDDIAQQAHVLSNLLRSLEEGAANSGPVQNILREMGIHPP